MTEEPSVTEEPMRMRRKGTVDWWTKERKIPDLVSFEPLKCPWCGSTDLDAEYVHNGVGMEKVTPMTCMTCDASQIRSASVKEATAEERRRGYWAPSEKGLSKIVIKHMGDTVQHYHPNQVGFANVAARHVLDTLTRQGYPIPEKHQVEVWVDAERGVLAWCVHIWKNGLLYLWVQDGV